MSLNEWRKVEKYFAESPSTVWTRTKSRWSLRASDLTRFFPRFLMLIKIFVFPQQLLSQKWSGVSREDRPWTSNVWNQETTLLFAVLIQMSRTTNQLFLSQQLTIRPTTMKNTGLTLWITNIPLILNCLRFDLWFGLLLPSQLMLATSSLKSTNSLMQNQKKKSTNSVSVMTVVQLFPRWRKTFFPRQNGTEKKNRQSSHHLIIPMNRKLKMKLEWS